jgi:hypothetical protein
MTMTNYFVTTVIGHDILGRLAGDFRAVLPEIVVVAQVDLLETRAHQTSTVEMAIPTLDTPPSTTDIRGLSKDKIEALR